MNTGKCSFIFGCLQFVAAGLPSPADKKLVYRRNKIVYRRNRKLVYRRNRS